MTCYVMKSSFPLVTLLILTIIASSTTVVDAFGGRYNNRFRSSIGGNRFAPSTVSPLFTPVDDVDDLFGWNDLSRTVDRDVPPASPGMGMRRHEDVVVEGENFDQSPPTVAVGSADGVSRKCDWLRCSANGHCCPNHVCVNTDDKDTLDGSAEHGRCAPLTGGRVGDECERADDCQPGLECESRFPFSFYKNGQCQRKDGGYRKEFGETCQDSHDCMTEAGQCCQLQRRARGHPVKVCAYFHDPDKCFGPVDANSDGGRERRRRPPPTYKSRLSFRPFDVGSIAHPDYMDAYRYGAAATADQNPFAHWMM